MLRRIRLAFYLLAASFVISTAACADATGPRGTTCDRSNGNVCQ